MIDKIVNSELTKDGIRYTTFPWIMDAHGVDFMFFVQDKMDSKTCLQLNDNDNPMISNGIYYWDYEMIVDVWNNSQKK